MMKNKIFLKKFLLHLFLIICLLITVFLTINIYEYYLYNKNYNEKISSIISVIEEKYPEVSEKELIKIINNENSENNRKEVFEKYNIDINKDILLKNNKKIFYRFIILNIVFYIITIILMLFYFLKFNNNKDNEINKITKYIEEINKQNYKLELDDMSEDELSILKNEIYKTTIILKEAAINSDKEKMELKKSLSDISHQLKTPLTSIMIILDNLIDEPDMEKEIQEEFIKDIKREINNINFFVQSILKLSKLDTNTISFNKEDVEILKIVKESINNVSILSDLKCVDFKLDFKCNPKIKCDFKWQVEAISNILKNCIEHSDVNSNINITIEDNKVYSEIIVKDNGEGIDKADLPHIFERFYKGKNATYDSVGIGLALAKSIIEKDNGKINVESSKDGTIFDIRYFKW